MYRTLLSLHSRLVLWSVWYYVRVLPDVSVCMSECFHLHCVTTCYDHSEALETTCSGPLHESAMLTNASRLQGATQVSRLVKQQRWQDGPAQYIAHFAHPIELELQADAEPSWNHWPTLYFEVSTAAYITSGGQSPTSLPCVRGGCLILTKQQERCISLSAGRFYRIIKCSRYFSVSARSSSKHHVVAGKPCTAV